MRCGSGAMQSFHSLWQQFPPLGRHCSPPTIVAGTAAVVQCSPLILCGSKSTYLEAVQSTHYCGRRPPLLGAPQCPHLLKQGPHCLWQCSPPPCSPHVEAAAPHSQSLCCAVPHSVWQKGSAVHPFWGVHFLGGVQCLKTKGMGGRTAMSSLGVWGSVPQPEGGSHCHRKWGVNETLGKVTASSMG